MLDSNCPNPISHDSHPVYKTLDGISKLHKWDWDAALAFMPEIIENSKTLMKNVIIPNCFNIVITPNTDMTISINGTLRYPAVPVEFTITPISTFTIKCQVENKEIHVCGVFEQSSLDYANNVLSSLIW